MPQYLDNAQLHSAFLRWRASDRFPHEIPEEITSALQALVAGLSHHGSFCGYSYLEDMRQQALVDILKWGVRTYDPERFRNPHAFFTMIAWRSFGGTIVREKKQRTPDALAVSEVLGNRLAAPAPDGGPERPSYGPFGTLGASQLTTLLKVSQGGRHRGNTRHVVAVCSAVGVDSRAELLILLQRHGAPIELPIERRPAPSNRKIGRQLRQLAGA